MRYLASVNIQIEVEADNSILAKNAALKLEGQILDANLLFPVIPKDILISMESKDKSKETKTISPRIV